MLTRRFFRIHLLDVVGDDNAAHVAFNLGDAHGAINHMPHLLRCRNHMDVFMRNVLEQRNKVDFLLIIAPSAARFCWPTIATMG
jgi:hypothetical protein